MVPSKKRLLDTGIDETFGKLCRRLLTFLAGPPALLVVAGPTGCGKLTAAQHCVARAGFGLVEVVNQSAASTQIISTIKRSGNMLSSTGSCMPSVIVVTGADGIQSGYPDLLSCSRACGKHVVVLVNDALPFATAKAAERHRCSWHRPWSSDALMAAIDEVPGANLLTIQEKGVMMRSSSDMRQLKIATELLVNVKQHGCDESELLRALVDSPVHQWYNTFSIMKGASLPTAHHNMNWIGGSYLCGLRPFALDNAADFANNLATADMLQQSSNSEFIDNFSTLVLQHSMPLVSHSNGLQIQKARLDLPRPNKRARYSATLEF